MTATMPNISMLITLMASSFPARGRQLNHSTQNTVNQAMSAYSMMDLITGPILSVVWLLFLR